MDRLTIRGSGADLLALDGDLEPVASLGGSVSGFEFGAASVRALDVENVMLAGGRIRAVRAERARLTSCRGPVRRGHRLRTGRPARQRPVGGDSAHYLKRVIVDRAQLLQLAEALAAELDVSFGEDVPS